MLNVFDKTQSSKHQTKSINKYNGVITETGHICISKTNSIIKLKIKDFITLSEYVRTIKSIKSFNFINLISNSVLWNSSKQMVNKGEFFVIPLDNKIYNVFTNNGILKINERTNIDGISEERILFYNSIKDNYRYNCFKYNGNGDTFFAKYYNKDMSLGSLDFTNEEAYEEINSITNNLRGVKEINDICDLNLIEDNVLSKLKTEPKQLQKKKTII